MRLSSTISLITILQLVDRRTEMPKVIGSNPVPRHFFFILSRIVFFGGGVGGSGVLISIIFVLVLCYCHAYTNMPSVYVRVICIVIWLKVWTNENFRLHFERNTTFSEELFYYRVSLRLGFGDLNKGRNNGVLRLKFKCTCLLVFVCKDVAVGVGLSLKIIKKVQHHKHFMLTWIMFIWNMKRAIVVPTANWNNFLLMLTPL